MGEWKEVVFGDLLPGGTRNGIYKPKEFHGRGAKIVNMGELFAYPRLRDVPMKRVALTESELKTATIQAGDLLFARRSLVAEGAGKCSIVMEVNEPTTFESSIIRARPESGSASSLFLYYFFNSPRGRYQLGTILRQVAVSGITGSDLVRLKLPLPLLSTQRHIAHILGTLDDKIELNRRMNRTLEKMAAAFFKSWFIDFDPVRAKADGRDTGLPAEVADLFPDTLEDSDLGPIPKGWTVGPLAEIASLRMRTIQPGKQPDVRWEHYSIPAYDEGQQPKRELGETIKSGKYAVPQGSVLVSKLNPQFPRIWLPWVSDAAVAICSTEFMPFVPQHADWRPFLYEMMTSRPLQEAIKAHVTGSTGSRQRAKPSEIAELTVLVPPSDAIAGFSHLVAPLHNRLMLNQRQNRRLADLRDALLPKLMCGEIEIPVAETGARRYK